MIYMAIYYLRNEQAQSMKFYCINFKECRARKHSDSKQSYSLAVGIYKKSVVKFFRLKDNLIF